MIALRYNGIQLGVPWLAYRTLTGKISRLRGLPQLHSGITSHSLPYFGGGGAESIQPDTPARQTSINILGRFSFVQWGHNSR